VSTHRYLNKQRALVFFFFLGVWYNVLYRKVLGGIDGT
jgi:hypothetical protein